MNGKEHVSNPSETHWLINFKNPVVIETVNLDTFISKVNVDSFIKTTQVFVRCMLYTKYS